jgi:hypothetical protein
MAVDIDAVRDEAILLLNAADAATLTWWDEDELADYADDAAQPLMVRNNIIANFYGSETLTNAQADYTFPELHKATVQIAVADDENGALVLREATVREMEAFDPDWTTDAADVNELPSHWVGNWRGMSGFRVTPIPSATSTWSIVQIEHPEQIEAGNLTCDVPSVLGEWFLLQMVGHALRKETRGARPETSQIIDQMLEPIEQLISTYWGK